MFEFFCNRCGRPCLDTVGEGKAEVCGRCAAELGLVTLPAASGLCGWCDGTGDANELELRCSEPRGVPYVPCPYCVGGMSQVAQELWG